MTIALELPRLRRDQYQIATHPAKSKDICAGRRWGKTVLGGVLVMNVLRQHGKCAWVVPTYKNGRSLWRWAQRVATPLAMAKVLDISKSERVIETNLGGFFGIFSADNIDAIRSEDLDLVVADEVARDDGEAYVDAVIPTLADRNGDEVKITTPKGLNWFYQECQRAKDADPNQAAFFHAPTSNNPNPNIKRAAMLAQDRVSERTYRQEWLAEFVEDGAFFQGIDQCATQLHTEQPHDHAEHSKVMGVDWGKQNDFTVITVGCRECNKVIDWLRTNKIDYHFQRAQLIDIAERWKVANILAESNSIGEPNIEELRRAGLPVRGFATTATSKPTLIEDFALSLRKGLKVPKVAADELKSFEVETRPNGAPKYAAPEGLHDDWVISLALCARIMKRAYFEGSLIV